MNQNGHLEINGKRIGEVESFELPKERTIYTPEVKAAIETIREASIKTESSVYSDIVNTMRNSLDFIEWWLRRSDSMEENQK